MPKRAIPVVLKQEERAALLRLTRRHSSAQQLVLRARVVLEASEGKSNAAIARELSTSVETVRVWRGRWVAQQEIEPTDRAVEERLADAPRPGAPAHISAEQRTQMAALACEAPAKTGRPISQWTGREIADELKARGIVSQISPRHAARLLKKGASSLSAFGTG